MNFYLWVFLCILFNQSVAQNLSSKEIIAKSIAFHDPDGSFVSGNFKLYLEESRPNGTVRETEIKLAPALESFEMVSLRDSNIISYKLNGEDIEILLNGQYEISTEDMKKHNLSKSRALTIKNYYLYLWYLPMKLNDPGTIVHEEFKEIIFNEKSSFEVKITYMESVGKDVWYFYFDTLNYQLIGYRFYHDEEDNDGEYIYLSGLTEYNNIKIPAERSWFTHKEDKFLGSDYLRAIIPNQ